MSEDGSMARMPELIDFATKHDLKVGTIADLIAYRLKNDTVVRRLQETEINSQFGGNFQMVLYENTIEYAEHAALVKGDLGGSNPILVRVHAVNSNFLIKRVVANIVAVKVVQSHDTSSCVGAGPILRLKPR